MHDPDHNPEIMTPRLKCDVVLELSGPNVQSLEKWAAGALRTLADRLERGELDDGFTNALDRSGKKVGTIYLDYSDEAAL